MTPDFTEQLHEIAFTRADLVEVLCGIEIKPVRRADATLLPAEDVADAIIEGLQARMRPAGSQPDRSHPG